MKSSIATLIAALSMQANSQVFDSKFDTKHHPKAKGVWATVRYPSGWEVKEGERPNIVKKFSGDYKGMYVVLSLQIRDAGSPVENECSQSSINDFAEAFSDTSNGIKVFDVKKIRHEGKPAFIYRMNAQLERAGISSNLSHRVMTVCRKNTLISSWCSPSTINHKTQSVGSTSRDLDSAEPLCLQFFNSLVLMENY